MPHRVFHWQADLWGSGYYRCHLPSQALDRLKGWRSESSTSMPVHRIDTVDLVVGQRICLDAAMPVWSILCNHPVGPITLYELDDLLTGVTADNREAFEFYGRINVARNLRRAIREAHGLIVSNELLGYELRHLNPQFHVLPNALPDWAPHLKTVAPERITVGWAGGSSHFLDISSVTGALKRFYADNPDVAFTSVGMDFSHLSGADHTSFVPWETDHRRYLSNLNFQVGIAPLRDTLFNRCKTPLKALEYGIRGIPTIASNVEPYNGYIRHAETGFLADTDDDWIEYLEALATDHGLREQMGAAAREQAEEHLMSRRIEQRAELYRSYL